MFGPILQLLFSFILLPLLLVLLQIQAVSLAFSNMGLSPTLVIAIFYLSLLGSFINIPISRRKIRVERRLPLPFPFSLPLFYYPPRVQEQVLAVNVGGAVIPVLLSLYVLPNAPIGTAMIAIAAVSAVCFVLARPVKGVGITLPAFISPIVAAALAYLLVPDPIGRTAVAYAAGVMGTLVGADILNLPRIHRLGGHVVSIGGAGVFDGIFLVGILAAILT
jgi:uncharacterized membrane protein